MSSSRAKGLNLPDMRRAMQRWKSIGRGVGSAFIGQVGGGRNKRNNKNILYNPNITAGKRNSEWHHWSSTREMATAAYIATCLLWGVVYAPLGSKTRSTHWGATACIAVTLNAFVNIFVIVVLHCFKFENDVLSCIVTRRNAVTYQYSNVPAPDRTITSKGCLLHRVRIDRPRGRSHIQWCML